MDDSATPPESVEVKLARLDELVTEPIQVLKIDVEGFEIAVLEGATGLLARSPTHLIIVEWQPHTLVAAGYAPAALPQWLAAHGYTVYYIADNENKVLPLPRDRFTDPAAVLQGQTHVNLAALSAGATAAGWSDRIMAHIA
jgi:hypothetical protein